MESNTPIGGGGSHANPRGVSVTSAGDAVVVRNAHKSYRSGLTVLKGLNMTVPCGSIYGLLGGSGTGKTTVLSCILRIQKLDRGKIWSFGKQPGEKSLGIPGRNVDYMPQELSLYTEFSIGETLNYFGTLKGMTIEDIGREGNNLASLLALPNGSKRIGSLSGGEQRRVSLVVALLSRAELLVLDEPTVGVDPLIRQKIWIHLKKIVKDYRTTVIITSHYIDECRSADNIGLMRNGRLLVERETTQLMLEHGSTNLEIIILDLARKDRTSLEEVDNSYNYSNTGDPSSKRKNVPLNMASVTLPQNPGPRDSLTRISALTRKNCVVHLRNPLWLFLNILCAAMVGFLANISIGQDPTDLVLGLVNNEIGHHNNFTCGNMTTLNGDMEMLSCKFLSQLSKHNIRLEVYNHESDALAAVQSGRNWGYISVPEDFSASFLDRFTSGMESTERIINSSQFLVRLDETDKIIASSIKVSLLSAFQDFAIDLLTDWGYDRRLAEYSLNFHEPIFGKGDTSFRDFLSPGCGLTLLLFFPIITTSLRFIKDKKSGILGRSLVAGVKTWEIMVAHSISESVILLLQAIVNYLMMTVLFKIKVEGMGILVFILFFLAGYCGVSLGFLLGSVCSEEIQAAMIAMACFMPNMFLSGVIWPMEGMVTYLQQVAQILPFTMAGEAVRSITSRGWEFSHPSVWPGFAIMVAYILGFLILNVILHMKYKG